MLTDRTRQVPDVAETVIADTFFSSGVTLTFKQALISIYSCTGCIAEHDFKSTFCALTNTDNLCKGCTDSHYNPHLFLFQISKKKPKQTGTKSEQFQWSRSFYTGIPLVYLILASDFLLVHKCICDLIKYNLNKNLLKASRSNFLLLWLKYELIMPFSDLSRE